jgi:hypothetical protein
LPHFLRLTCTHPGLQVNVVEVRPRNYFRRACIPMWTPVRLKLPGVKALIFFLPLFFWNQFIFYLSTHHPEEGSNSCLFQHRCHTVHPSNKYDRNKINIQEINSVLQDADRHRHRHRHRHTETRHTHKINYNKNSHYCQLFFLLFLLLLLLLLLPIIIYVTL